MIATEKPCSRCKVNPRVPNQRWCRECRAEAKRNARPKAQPVPLAPLKEIENREQLYTPYKGIEPAHRWYVDYLNAYALEGGEHLAAQAAGIPYSLVEAARNQDAVFDHECTAALEFYRDLIEWQSVDLARRKGNPLPFFARLKAERPDRYVEKQITANFNVNTSNADLSEAADFLAQLMGSATGATRAELQGMRALPGPADQDIASPASPRAARQE